MVKEVTSSNDNDICTSDIDAKKSNNDLAVVGTPLLFWRGEIISIVVAVVVVVVVVIID